jgi:O-antigen ligase
MVQSVTFGLYLTVCGAAGWVLWRRLPRGGQLAALAVVPLLAAAVFCSHTRSVWLGAGVSGLVLVALTLRGGLRAAVLSAGTAAALFGGALFYESILHFERGDNSAEQTQDSATLRRSFAYVSWQMFLDRPLLGAGFGQFTEAKLPYLADRSTDLRLEPIRDWTHHNTYLSVLTETGLIGLGALLATLAAWVGCGWRLCRDPRSPSWVRAHGALLLAALGAYGVQLAWHELSFLPLDNGLVFLLAGIGMGLWRRDTGHDAGDTRSG